MTKYTEHRIDITGLAMADLNKLDLESIERIERSDGKVTAVIIKRCNK